jgi:hypothetical protein
MDKDTLSINDWVKISIKFSGLCLNCKKKIDSGEYGYWSRLSRSVLHQSCYDSLFLPQRLPSSSPSPSSSSSLSSTPREAHSDSIVKKRDRKTKCFICSGQVDFDNELMKSLSGLCEKYDSNSDIIYCNRCLDGFNNDVYAEYKRRFMSIS